MAARIEAGFAERSKPLTGGRPLVGACTRNPIDGVVAWPPRVWRVDAAAGHRQRQIVISSRLTLG
jgi:hypothetical protein